jgi:hypothetical protein
MVDVVRVAACNLRRNFAPNQLQVQPTVILGTTISRRIGKPTSSTIQRKKVHHTGDVKKFITPAK